MTSRAIISTIQQRTIAVIAWLFFACFFDLKGQDHLCDSLEIQLIFAEDSQKLRIYDDLIRIHRHALLQIA